MKRLSNIIDGTPVEAADPELRSVVNPATEQVVALIPAGSAADAAAAVESAQAAHAGWARLDLEDRLGRLSRTADLLERHVRELAELENREMGKPVPLAEQFIAGGIASFRLGIERARSYPFVADVTAPGESGRTVVIREPLGVLALIVPWNFTVTSILGALGPLLAAGNTVVIKPSEKAPLSAARLVELCDLPAGVVNLLLGDARAGKPLAEHEAVKLVHFTGSVEAGRSVAVAAAKRLQRTILELGGNDPVLVDADVDVAATAKAVATSTFLNSGQICTSSERIYVHRAVADEFIAALVAEAEGWTMSDDPYSPGLGPLVDDTQRRIVHDHVHEAVDRGATLLCGGGRPDRPGYFYPATVLTEVTSDMRIMKEETFGPVAPVTVVDSFAEAIDLANTTSFGLAATVYSSTPENLRRCREINAALVWINEWQHGGVNMVHEPWGVSGMGATGAAASFDAATRPVSMLYSPSTNHG
ncbi:aldehyde dehydrogenase family protein [Nonomuraea angiospora]|uniref:Succinate-semialdehyde dehydrogenase/glutarate-semialdehyde dehydrogenase n=1 Tax=Nonomuraea angiospora TaxID=46172 RepID=A0ABR9MHF0_9ACTN|nr:aldehyde dehydrogenase family protein [Nonomuraea angiospora]MBE1592340.1 succinate-semialdehyde dehydrogenase/glutarate-semialdehyde dehydrogenase [Nonomuraea angiospora]